MTGGLIRQRRGERDTQRRNDTETEAEMGGMWPHAQGHLEPPESARGRKEPPLDPVQGARPCDTLNVDLEPPQL